MPAQTARPRSSSCGGGAGVHYAPDAGKAEDRMRMSFVPSSAAVAMALIALACGPAVGAGMSRQEYQAAKKRIAVEYQAERQKCGPRHGNALDLCIARVHGARDV